MIDFSYTAPDISLTHHCNRAPVTLNFTMHTHTHAEVYYFLGGKVTYHIEGSEYTLVPGDILLLRPGEAHCAQVSSQPDYERICLHFDPKLLSSLDPEGSLIRPFFDRQPGKRNLYRTDNDACTQLLSSMTVPKAEPRLNILGNLILLLKHISDAFEAGHEGSRTPDTLEYRLISYINKNLEGELTLHELCDRFFVSRTQLCRLFKQATGTSVGNYISTKRMLLARELLLQGQKPTEIYTICGYRDYTAFFRAYTRQYGHSPREEQRCSYPIQPNTRIPIG